MIKFRLFALVAGWLAIGSAAFAQTPVQAMAAKLKAQCQTSGPGMGGSLDCQCVGDKTAQYHDKLVAEARVDPRRLAMFESRKQAVKNRCAEPTTTAAQCAQDTQRLDAFDPAKITTVQDALVMMAIDKAGACKASAQMFKTAQMAECMRQAKPQPMYSKKSKEEYCGCYTDNLVKLHVGPPGTRVGEGNLAGSTPTAAALACQ